MTPRIHIWTVGMLRSEGVENGTAATTSLSSLHFPLLLLAIPRRGQAKVRPHPTVEHRLSHLKPRPGHYSIYSKGLLDRNRFFKLHFSSKYTPPPCSANVHSHSDTPRKESTRTFYQVDRGTLSSHTGKESKFLVFPRSSSFY